MALCARLQTTQQVKLKIIKKYMSDAKVIVKSGQQAGAIIKSAVDKVGNVVRKTLGPAGRNVLVDRGDWKTPRITNDGVFIAKNYRIDDPAENLVARILVQAAEKTNEIAGDGTTTAIVIAQKIIKTVFDEIEESVVAVEDTDLELNTGTSLMEYKKQIYEAYKKADTELVKQGKKIKSKEDLEKITLCSMENPEIASVIADVVMKVGAEGYVGVEEGYHGVIETDVVEGMQKRARLAETFMQTNRERKEMDVPNPRILVTSYNMEGIDRLVSITNLCNKLIKKEVRQLVVIAPKFDKTSIVFAAKFLRQGFRLFLVKAPTLNEKDGDELEDVAVYVGAKFFSEVKGLELKNLTEDDLGKAKRVVVNSEGQMAIFQGAGTEDSKKRAEVLKEQSKLEKDAIWKKKIAQRIASLTSGIGVIRVGALTDVETGYLKLKVEDTINAAKAALEEGYVQGGGLALKQVAEKLPKNILTDALLAPYEQIQENAGGKLEIGENVIDPLKVTRTALSNACSVASILITSDSILVEKDVDIGEKLRETLGLRKNEDVYIGEE